MLLMFSLPNLMTSIQTSSQESLLGHTDFLLYVLPRKVLGSLGNICADNAAIYDRTSKRVVAGLAADLALTEL